MVKRELARQWLMASAAGTAICALPGGAGTALAQTAAEADVSNPGEIIVTAQKRAQKLSDVGITIAAATTGQLQSSGVTDVSQLAKVVPGFSTGTTVVGGYKVFSLRGINFNADMISAPPAVSVYVDEAALPYSAMTGGLLLDVERIEVLKGPQGTLFGQNATGGSINVIAAKPTADLRGGFKAEVNQFGEVMAEGYVSGPVSDTLLARLAATTTQFGAWQKGYYLNNDRNGDQNKGAARLILEWSPTDALTVTTNLNANYDHSEQPQYQFGGFAEVVPGGAQPGLANYPYPTDNRDADITPGTDTRSRSRMYQGVLRIDYDISDAARLTSITNYADYKTRAFRDADGTAFDVINYGPIGRIKTFNQEVRLSGSVADNRLSYIIGGNYQKDRILDVNNNYFPGYSALPPGASLSTAARLRNRSAGVFGNVDFEVVDRLTLTGGVRYTSTRQTYAGCLTGNEGGAAVLGSIAGAYRSIAGLPPTDAYVAGSCMTINDTVANTPNPAGPGLIPDYLPIFGNRRQKENNVSWRAGVNFKPSNDSLVYALVSRGFKSGLIPVQQNLLDSALKPISQEKLTSYEGGAKLGLLGNAVRINLSGFYYQYVDKQFFTFKPVPVVGYGSDVVNIPKSTVKGVDLEAVVTPTSGLTLRGAATYIKTRVGTFETFDSHGEPLVATGSVFNYAPAWSGTFDAEYKFPVGEDLTGMIGGGGAFNSHTFSALGEDPLSYIPDYLTVDARVGIQSSHGWSVGLFARNLTNKYYYTATFGSGDTFVRVPGRPRVFGANFQMNF